MGHPPAVRLRDVGEFLRRVSTLQGDDIRACAQQARCDGRADPARGAGDGGGQPGQVEHAHYAASCSVSRSRSRVSGAMMVATTLIAMIAVM